MANEVRVYEMQSLRGKGQARPVQFRHKQILSIDGAASAAFMGNTNMVTILSTVACWIKFGDAHTFPIAENVLYDFDVKPGMTVEADSTES